MEYREFVENYWNRHKDDDAPFYKFGEAQRLEFDAFVKLVEQCEKDGTQLMISKPRVSPGYTLEGKMYRNWKMLSELKSGKKICLLTPDEYVEKCRDEFHRFTGEEIDIEKVDGAWVCTLKKAAP